MDTLFAAFERAVLAKIRGDMGPAAEFIENFDVLVYALDADEETRNKLRRGMFQILK